MNALILWYAIILHWIWGALLLSSAAPLYVTAVSTTTRLGLASPRGAGAFYLFLSILAMIGMGASKKVFLPLVLPQASILWVAASGAILAMYHGQFADGVQRPHAFLIADQAPAVIAAVLHTICVIDLYRKKEA